MDKQLYNLLKLQLLNETEKSIHITKIMFDDNSFYEIQSLILAWNIPFFNNCIKSNFIESNNNEIKLNGFSKEVFKNCLEVAIFNKYKEYKSDNKLFQIKEKLKHVILEDEFIEYMKNLKMYYDKFDYLGISKGCNIIMKIIGKNIVVKQLIDLGDKNIYFEISKEEYEEKIRMAKYEKILDDVVRYRFEKDVSEFTLYEIIDIINAVDNFDLFFDKGETPYLYYYNTGLYLESLEKQLEINGPIDLRYRCAVLCVKYGHGNSTNSKYTKIVNNLFDECVKQEEIGCKDDYY